MSPQSETFKLEKITGLLAILSSGQKRAEVPRSLLPKGAKVGDEIVMKLANSKEEIESQQKTAREILNEILGSK